MMHKACTPAYIRNKHWENLCIEEVFSARRKMKELAIDESHTLKRALESSELAGYLWSDDRNCYVKKYGPIPAHNKKYLVRFTYKCDKYLAVIYSPIEFPFTYIAIIWYVIGRLFEDVRRLKFEDINEIYCVENDMDMLKWLNEYKENAV